MLRKGNLSPKERVLLVIRNDAHFQKTGKELINEADMTALTVNWKPQDYREAEKYNQYLAVWEMFQKLELDMQTTYLTSMLSLSRMEHIATLFYHEKDAPKERQYYLEHLIPDDHEKEFRLFFLKHSGFEYDKLLHLCTFYSLPKVLQQDILLLDPYADSDHAYFLAEAQLARILTNKETLNDVEVEELTKIIINTIPWGHELSFLEHKISIKEVLFNINFAGYPMLEFGKRLASRHNIWYEDDDDLRKKLSQLSDLRYKLESVICDSVRDGLFFNEYIPHCNNSGFKTYVGETKLPHNEIMRLWLKAKNIQTKKLQEHIDSGELVLEQCPTRFFEVSLDKTYVTGVSLIQSYSKLPFVSDYQKQLDEVLLFAYPSFLTSESVAFSNYQHLLAFEAIAERMSEMVGVDVTDKTSMYLKEIADSVNTLNFYFRNVSDHIDQCIYEAKNHQYPLQTFLPDIGIELHNLQPKPSKGIDIFLKEADKLLEWKATAKD